MKPESRSQKSEVEVRRQRPLSAVRRLLSVLCLLASVLCPPPASAAFTAQWFFSEAPFSSPAVRQVFVTPLWTITASGTNLLVGAQRSPRATVSGTLSISNLNAGGYRLEYVGPFTPIIFTNVFGAEVTGLVNGKDYISAALAVNATTVAYSQAAADARFATLVYTLALSNSLWLTIQAETNAPTFYGPVRVTSPTGIYGASGSSLMINGNTAPAIDAFGSWLRVLADVNGIQFYNPSGTRVHLQIDSAGRVQTPTHTSSSTSIAADYQNPQTEFGVVGLSQQPFGAHTQNRLGILGGDASGLASLPSSGHDIWHHGIQDPQVYATGWWTYGTNFGATAITNIIQNWATNGIYAAMTNRGLRPTIMLDAAWMQQNRSATGEILVNSNLYPSGMVAFKNYLNAQGYWLEGGIYYVGTLTNKEWVGILGNSGSTATPGDMKVAATTPITISRDMVVFYSYFDSLRVADYQPADGVQQTAGHQLQSMRQWSFAVKHPGGIQWNKAGYARRLGLSWFQGESPYTIPETVLNINVLNSDQFTENQATPVSTATKSLRFNNTNTSWAIGRGHFMSIFVAAWHNVPLAQRSAGSTNNNVSWKSFLTAGALHSAVLQTDTDMPNHGATNLINSGLMDVYFDPAYHPAWASADDGVHSTWIKPLTKGRYAVALFNESATNRSVTVNWTDFNPPRDWHPIQPPPQFNGTNSVFRVSDVWGQTNFGYFDTTFTASVPASNFVFAVFTPVYFQDLTAFALARADGAAFCTSTLSGGAPFEIQDGIRHAPGAGSMVFPVPNWTTNVTLQWKQYAATTYSQWQNTMSPQYIGGVIRFWNSGGVAQTSHTTSANNTVLTNIQMAATFPQTNATKWLVLFVGAATNATDRIMASPIRVICE